MSLLTVAVLLVLAYGLGVWSAPWFKTTVEPELEDLIHAAGDRFEDLKEKVESAEVAIGERFKKDA